MKNKKYIKTVLLTISVSSIFLCANAKVTVSGKIQGIKGKVEAYYNIPIDGFANMFFNDKSIKFNNDLSFSISFDINISGFVYIRFPGKMITLLVDPRADMFLQLYYQKIKSIRWDSIYALKNLIIEGDNSLGNLLYYKYDSAKVLFQPFLSSSLFTKKQYNSVLEFFDTTTRFIDSLVSPFGTLYNNNKISRVFYNIVAADITSTLALNIITLFSGLTPVLDYSRNDTPAGAMGNIIRLNKHLLAEKKLDSLTAWMYKKYDPLDTNILASAMGVFYSQLYYTSIYNGTIKTSSIYNNDFSFLKEDDKCFGFMQGRFLEVLWKISLYWSAVDGSDEQLVTQSFQLFKRYFPNSAFLPYLKERLGPVLSATRNDDYAKATNDEKKFIYLNKNDKTLPEAVTGNLAGNYVFVDIWATWCKPCLEEFAFKNSLDSFLQSKNIKILYVSVDKIEDENKWKAFINNKKLSGYHILASKELLEYLGQNIFVNGVIAIPRYLLINKNGIIINKDLPRPSDMKNLKQTINQLL